MVALFQSIRKRLFKPANKIYQTTYEVTFGIYHDEVEVSSFKMLVKAQSKRHAEMIVKKYMVVKPINITVKKS